MFDEQLQLFETETYWAPICPYCGLVMSRREAAEQAACNDCYDSAWSPFRLEDDCDADD